MFPEIFIILCRIYLTIFNNKWDQKNRAKKWPYNRFGIVSDDHLTDMYCNSIHTQNSQYTQGQD